MIFYKHLRQSAIQEKNKHSIVSILIDVAHTLARQGLVFRNQNDCENESQNGNFYQVVLFLS